MNDEPNAKDLSAEIYADLRQTIAGPLLGILAGTHQLTIERFTSTFSPFDGGSKVLTTMNIFIGERKKDGDQT
jgi:hypothetical protein